MRNFRFILPAFFAMMAGDRMVGQTFAELVQLCKENYFSMPVVSGVISLTLDKEEAVSKSRKLLFKDERNIPWRLLILPEAQMDFLYIGDTTYVFMHNLKAYYYDTDSIAFLRFESYLDPISTIVLAKTKSEVTVDTASKLRERMVDKENGVKEVTITSPNDPEVGLTDIIFTIGFDMISRSPKFVNTSYRFMGDLVREEIVLDTVYSNPAESDLILAKVRETIKLYTFLPPEDLQSEPKKIFSFFDVANGLEYVNQAPGASKYYLLDIYFTNCGPCIRALSHIKSVLQELPPGTLSVVAVNTLDTKEKIEIFNEKNMIKYSSAMASSDFITQTIGPVTYPTFFLFDSEGTLLLESYGFYPEFFDKVRELVSK